MLPRTLQQGCQTQLALLPVSCTGTESLPTLLVLDCSICTGQQVSLKRVRVCTCVRACCCC